MLKSKQFSKRKTCSESYSKSCDNNYFGFRKRRFFNGVLDEMHENRNNRNHDDESDHDTEHPKKKSESKKVYRIHNHIYFCTDVNMDTVRTLCDLIDEANREYDSLQSGLTTLMITPKPIYLHITSFGGELVAGFNAFDHIENSRIPIYTIVEGYAISSGANLFMAGKKRFMTKNSYILIHQLNMTKYGEETFHQMIDTTSNIIEFMSKIYSIFLNNLRYNRENVLESDILTKEKLENHMSHDLYWNIETCMRYGLADSIYTNYRSVDETDVMEYLSHRLFSSQKQDKNYTLDELKPSDNVIKKIRENIEKTKKENDNRMIKFINKYLGSKPSTMTKSDDAISNTIDHSLYNFDNYDDNKFDDCKDNESDQTQSGFNKEIIIDNDDKESNDENNSDQVQLQNQPAHKITTRSMKNQK